MAKTKAQFTPQMTVGQFEAMFPDDDACKTYLQARRWPNGVCCPRCGSSKVFELKTMPFKWECMACGKSTSYRFSVLVGTAFENTNVGLRNWFRVIHMMLTGKKGVAALEVQRVLGFGSYRTAHYLCMRVRAGLVDPDFRKLVGIVEVDETYVGGKNKNRHFDERTPGTGAVGKFPVMGAVSRKGTVVARALANVNQETAEAFVQAAVSEKVDLVATDESGVYNRLTKKGFKHESVAHARGEYVRGNVHTQTIDGFWSLLKRGILGTFHNVSAKYLPLYVAEFEFRYNNRNNPDIFGAAVARC
jgi:transposase-like protein